MDKKISDDKVAALRKMRIIATSLLIGLTIIFISTRPFKHIHISIALINAFAEAGMIGALADWFAVVALFRHPMGIPIPHTAILPQNKERLGKYLSQFILGNFLNEENIKIKIHELKITDTLIRYFDENKDVFLNNIVAFIPHAIELAENSELKNTLKEKTSEFIDKLPITDFTIKILDNLIEKKEHQKLLTIATNIGIDFISKEDELIRSLVYEKLPVGTKKMLTDLVTKEIIKSIGTLLSDIINNTGHDVRIKFDKIILEYVNNLRENKDNDNDIEKLKKQLLSDLTITNQFDNIWDKIKEWAISDIEKDNSTIKSSIDGIFKAIFQSLNTNPATKAKTDAVVTEIVTKFVTNNLPVIGQIIDDTFARWDTKTMATKLEVQVGKDLQYIRINGSLVGGLVGVVIYIFSEVIFK